MKYLGITKPLPKQHRIHIKLSGKQFQKLAKWFSKNDDIAVCANASNNEVILLNKTLNQKWQIKQIRKKHVVEIEEK